VKRKSGWKNPEHGLTPVSGLAYDLGYASLGPFNRAFKEVTGQTPTEYRRAVLADSGKD
jgi:AraC-like DNA-binding protein